LKGRDPVLSCKNSPFSCCFIQTREEVINHARMRPKGQNNGDGFETLNRKLKREKDSWSPRKTPEAANTSRLIRHTLKGRADMMREGGESKVNKKETKLFFHRQNSFRGVGHWGKPTRLRHLSGKTQSLGRKSHTKVVRKKKTQKKKTKKTHTTQEKTASAFSRLEWHCRKTLSHSFLENTGERKNCNWKGHIHDKIPQRSRCASRRNQALRANRLKTITAGKKRNDGSRLCVVSLWLAQASPLRLKGGTRC